MRVVTRFALSEWFVAEWSARTVILPHGEEARARDAAAMLLMFRGRAVSNHEGGPCVATPQDEVAQAVFAARLSAD